VTATVMDNYIAPRRLLLAAVLCLACAAVAWGQSQPPLGAPQAVGNPSSKVPKLLQDVGIDQKLGAQVPLDLEFRDSTGNSVKLGQLINGKRPVILTLVYFQCPMLCTMVLNDLNGTLRMISNMSIGRDFDVVTVSFNPKETPALAAQKKAEYLKTYHRAGAEAGWHFLTGDPASIKALTQAVGFRYAYDARTEQFAHASGIIILTPTGRISRYFYGVDYMPVDVRLSLTQASGGKVGSLAEQVLLYCFHYDATLGRYSLAITRILSVMAALTVLALGGGVFWMVRLERRRQRHAAILTESSWTDATQQEP